MAAVRTLAEVPESAPVFTTEAPGNGATAAASPVAAAPPALTSETDEPPWPMLSATLILAVAFGVANT